MTSKPHHDSDSRAIIEKQPGCWEFKPRAFNIVWGNDARYWNIPSNIWTNQPLELRQVSWLEVTSSVFLLEGKKYEISFKISFKSNAFGWTGTSVYLMAKVGRRGEYKWTRLSQLEQCPRQPTDVPPPNDPFIIETPKPMPNKFNDTRLYFGLYEVWSGSWKGGLVIYSATVKERPN